MSSPQPRTFVLASRKSPMAQAQTVQVQAALRALDTSPSAPKFETSFMSTAGDKNQVQALYFLGGKELWTGDLEVALKERAADMLVHSLKDVPTVLPEGFVLAGISERDEPVDVMCVKAGMPWRTPEELPEGSVVGTSSVRRIAMLKRRFPHLKFLDVVRVVCPPDRQAILTFFHPFSSSAATCTFPLPLTYCTHTHNIPVIVPPASRS